MTLKANKKLDIHNLEMAIRDRKRWKNFLVFIIGMLICSVSINLFYQPYKIVPSGSTGLAMLISKILDIDLSITVLAIFSIMFLFSLVVFGPKYGSINFLGTIFYPIFIKACSLFNRFILFDEMSLLFITIIGGTLMGVGFGIVRKSGYVLGGIDFIYDVVHKKFKVSIGKATLICNLVIILLSAFLFGIDKSIYSVIALYISSMVSDKVMLGVSRNKAFYIVTRKPMEIRDYIIDNLNHTVTIVNARGGYSDKKKKMLICVIPTIEYIRVKEVITKIDKSAFFLITDSYYSSK